MMHRGPGARKHPGRIARARAGALTLAWFILAGCPSRFDPRAETMAGLPQARGTDPALDAAWQDARARYDRGDFAKARDAFAALRQGSPVAAVPATLWEARCLLELQDPAGARQLVEPLVNAASPGEARGESAQAAQLLLGLALGRQGEAARSRALLEPLGAVIVDGPDAVELHAALAEGAAAQKDVPVALAELERFFAGARPAERAWVRDRAVQLVASLPDAQARALWTSSPPEGLVRAVISERLAGQVADPAGASALRQEGLRARARLGFPSLSSSPSSAGGGTLLRAVGLVLPLSGKNRLLGERALRGALLGANLLPEPAVPLTGESGAPLPAAPAGPAVELLVRDSASQPEAAAAAVEELGAAGVAFVVLSPDRAEAAAGAARAEVLGLPAFDLSLDEGPGSPGRFRLLRPNVARATALAAHARKGGARRVAVLYPDGAYGRRMAEAFVQAAQAGGATVVAQLHVDEKATTFIAPAKKLAELAPDAVFVPAAAGQLELIAAQLATLGVTRPSSAAVPGAGVGPGRGALLLATADGAGPRMLQNAGRYLQGAVLAPVFLASLTGDDEASSRVARYRAAFGEEPGAADALGHDAAAVASDALSRLPIDSIPAPAGRRALLQLVAGGALASTGLTGAIGFLPDGQRAGAPRLVAVEGDRVRVLP